MFNFSSGRFMFKGVLFSIVFVFILFSCKKQEEQEGEIQKIEYPSTGHFGINLLSSDYDTIYVAETFNSSFSLNAKLNGRALKVVLKSVKKSEWGFSLGTSTNWYISNFNFNDSSQALTTVSGAQECDIDFKIWKIGPIQIDYYEDGIDKVSFSRVLTCIKDTLN